jgi:hypothetical protein
MHEIWGLFEDPGFWAIMGTPFLIGLVGAVAALVWMKREGSPFIKIAADAVHIFAVDPHLRLLPLFVGASCVLSTAAAAQLFIEFPGTLHSLASLRVPLDFSALEGPLLIACVVGAQFGGLAIAAANAVLADAFIERCHGRPALFSASTGRVFRRLPRLLAFTFLWWGLLSVIVIVKLKLGGFLKGLGETTTALAVDFAGFALETGLVMAAYLMLVVMLREDIGPIEAMARTLEIVRREYAATLGELARLKILDGSVKIMMYGAGAFGEIIAVVVGFHLHSQGILTMGWLTAFVAIGAMAPCFLVGAGYYTIIQTLQLLLACAVFLFVHDGIMVDGFSREDFENVLCLKAGDLPSGVAGPPSPRV